jgi:cytoskeletal protein RodZ
MSSILKQKREELNLAISDISSVIRVRAHLLEAIENDIYDDMPLEIYTRGYIKVYAKYLGVPYGQAVAPYEEYLASKAKIAAPETPAQEAEPASSTPVQSDREFLRDRQDIQLEPRDSSFAVHKSGAAVSWFRKAAVALGAFLFFFFAGFFIYYYLMPDSPDKNDTKKEAAQRPTTRPALPAVQPQNQPEKAETAAQPAATPGSQGTALASANDKKAVLEVIPDTADDTNSNERSSLTKSGLSKADENQNPLRKKHVLVVSATEQTTLQLLIDGKDTINISLAPGETRTLNAFRSFSGVVSDGGAVKLKFNGKQLPQGKKGEAKHFNLPARS